MKNFDHPMKRIKKCESKRLQKNLMNIIRPRSLILTLVGLLLVTFSAAADTSVEGVVKDATGRPIKGADVRIEAKNFSKILKTDASGHYVTHGLAAGTYKVMLVINGQVKAVILDAKTQLDKPTQLNFDLSGKRASAKKHTRMVWIPSNIIGTNIIGGGRWVEVDDNGNIVDNTGFNNVEKFRRPAVYGKDIMTINPGIYTGDH
jgi:carboxypeptidase family protein